MSCRGHGLELRRLALVECRHQRLPTLDPRLDLLEPRRNRSASLLRLLSWPSATFRFWATNARTVFSGSSFPPANAGWSDGTSSVGGGGLAVGRSIDEPSRAFGASARFGTGVPGTCSSPGKGNDEAGGTGKAGSGFGRFLRPGAPNHPAEPDQAREHHGPGQPWRNPERGFFRRLDPGLFDDGDEHLRRDLGIGHHEAPPLRRIQQWESSPTSG